MGEGYSGMNSPDVKMEEKSTKVIEKVARNGYRGMVKWLPETQAWMSHAILGLCWNGSGWGWINGVNNG